jgi:hypothetical protein
MNTLLLHIITNMSNPLHIIIAELPKVVQQPEEVQQTIVSSQGHFLDGVNRSDEIEKALELASMCRRKRVLRDDDDDDNDEKVIPRQCKSKKRVLCDDDDDDEKVIEPERKKQASSSSSQVEVSEVFYENVTHDERKMIRRALGMRTVRYCEHPDAPYLRSMKKHVSHYSNWQYDRKYNGPSSFQK